MKKILALVLAFVMLLSLLAACDTDKPSDTKPQETNKPAETKPGETQPQETQAPGITFPLAETLEVSFMYVNGNASFPIADNVVWKHLQEQANMKFDAIEFASTDLKEKGNLLLSGGDYPQVLFKCSSNVDINKYGMDGLMIPLEELIRECCPNLSALLDERNAWNAITAPDGHIYALPGISDPMNDSMHMWVNTKWLENVGMDMPTNKEEFYQVLKAFKEQDANGNGDPNDEIPWLPQAGTQIASIIGLINYFGDAGLWMQSYWCAQDGEMVYLPTTEYFKEDWIKYLKKLYDEGLMHPEAFTLKQADTKAICSSGDDTVGLFYHSSTTHYADLETWDQWAILKPFNNESFALKNGVTANAMALTDKCDEETARILLTWVDQLYTEEGGWLPRIGIEGETFTINADGTYTMHEENYEDYTYQCTLMGAGTVPYLLPQLYITGTADPQEIHDNNEIYFSSYAEGVIVPTLTYTEDETEERAALWTDINSYVRNYVAECVTGIADVEATWAEFQATLEAMGVERLVEITDAAYQRAMGN